MKPVPSKRILFLFTAISISLAVGYLLSLFSSRTLLLPTGFFGLFTGFFLATAYFRIANKPLDWKLVNPIHVFIILYLSSTMHNILLKFIQSPLFPDSPTWLDSPLLGLIFLLPLLFGSAFAVYSRRIQERNPLRVVESPDVSHSKVVRSIFESQEFLSALRTTLPSGKDDQQFGFDHVPYLLHNIDERRRRFTASSRLFLSLTLSLGASFVVLLAVFGYILINDDATGSGRRLAQVSAAMRSIESTLPDLVNIDINESAALLSSLRDLGSASSIQELGLAPETSAQLKIRVEKALEKKSFAGLAEYFLTLERIGLKQDQVDRLDKMMTSLTDFTMRQDLESRQLRRDINELHRVIPIFEKQSQRDESRIPELLKRITLGIVVASFFLAVLRYLAHIYQEHLHEVIKAERDDMAVRSFYVAFRCSNDSEDLRKSVLQEFMRRDNLSGPIKSGEEGELKQGPEYDILKELLSVIAKKI